jgi:hypothetical protein
MYAVSILAYYLLTYGNHPFMSFDKKATFEIHKQIESNWDILDHNDDIAE